MLACWQSTWLGGRLSRPCRQGSPAGRSARASLRVAAEVSETLGYSAGRSDVAAASSCCFAGAATAGADSTFAAGGANLQLSAFLL